MLIYLKKKKSLRLFSLNQRLQREKKFIIIMVFKAGGMINHNIIYKLKRQIFTCKYK